MFVSFENTSKLLFERTRINMSKDSISKVNKFTQKPQGIIIQDTYNNPFFPIPYPQVDTAKVNVSKIFESYHELYGQGKSNFLPWHYCIEFIKDRYVVFNTRPIDMKFPLQSSEAEKLFKAEEVVWDRITSLFFRNKIFDINDAIHICVIGDTNTDVYTQQFYTLLGASCITPMVRYFKIPGLFQNIFSLNMGKRFNPVYLEKHITR